MLYFCRKVKSTHPPIFSIPLEVESTNENSDPKCQEEIFDCYEK